MDAVRVGKSILNLDNITAIDDDGDSVHVWYIGGDDWGIPFTGEDAADLRALFAHVRAARQMVADRQPQVEPNRQTLLMLVKDAAEIIKAYDVAWVGHVDSCDTGEWLDRAQYVLGLEDAV